MDFEEVVLESKQSSGTDQILDESVRGKFSKTVIGEDLRRAIIALRSVPRVSWSQDLIYNGNDDASTEYIWRSIDLSGSSTFAGDWRDTTKLHDCNQRSLLTNNVVPKLVASQKQNQSEIMRKDSFTVASKRLDRTSDSKCQLVEQSTTAIQMSLFSSEKPGKANNIGETSTPNALTGSTAGTTAVMKKPPPLPPKPSHLQNLKIKQPVTGRLVSDGESCIPGGVKNLRKTSRTDQDAGDVYERSLDVLEKYDSDQEDFEDLMSPRSESPECLLEELLDSVPAEEFDTMESHYTTTPSSSIKNNRTADRADLSSSDNSKPTSGGADLQATQNKATVKKDMLSYNNSNHKSSGVEEQRATRNRTTVKTEVLRSDNSRHNRSIAEDQKAKQNITSVKADVLSFNNSGQISREAKEQAIQTKSNEPKFNRTSSSETVSIPQKNPLTRHQRNNNLSFKPVYVHPKPVPRKLDFSALRIIHTPQIKSSSTATTPVTVASDKELTPEDIFEEIMDSLEEGREDQGKGGVQSSSIRDNNRDGKPIQQDPSGRTDYMLENEWLAIYCDQIQGDIQHEMINKSRESKRTIDTTSSEPSKSSTREDIFKLKQISKPLPGLPANLPSTNGKIFPGPTLSLPERGNYQGQSVSLLPTTQDRKALPGPNTTLLSRNEKAPQVLTKPLPLPREKVLLGLNARLSSPDGRAVQGSNSQLSPSDGKTLQGVNTRLNSPDAKVTLSSQDTIQTTVKRKPAAPLRETVQTYTFVKKESLMQDIKLSPTIKSQQLAAKQNTQILSNGFSTINSPNSYIELKQEPVTIAYETLENHRTADSTSTAESNVRPSDEIKRLNTRSVTRKRETESVIIAIDRDISHSPDRIVPVITREFELPGCDTYEEEDMDLDLEIELSRNLDECTASDVECQSIDKLVTTESLFFSDTTLVRRPKKANSLEVKVPRKVGESLAKKRLKKSQSIDSTPVTSNKVGNKENTTISIPEKGTYSPQEANVAEFQESAVKNLKERSNFETTRKNFPGYSEDSELFKHEAVVEKPPIYEVADTTVLPGSSSGSDNEDNYKRTIIRNVRSAEKESTTELDGKQPTIQVLSEEVTSQEILLKIVWPKHESKSKGSKIIESKKPPFRELQLKRVKRISDLDSPLDVFPNVGHSQPLLAVTQQSQNALSTGHKPQPNDGKGVTPADINTVSTKNLSEIVVEYVNQKNGRNVEHISNSAIDVQRAETVKVLRVPMSAVHKVQDIKEAVEAVGSTILSDLHGQPKKRNILVTCEAVESKSRASLHDQDVTVIRNTIVDTYGPKPAAIVFSSGPKNSVQNM